MNQIHNGLEDVEETIKLNKNIIEDIDYMFDGTYQYKTHWTCSKCLEVIEIDYDICDYCASKRPQFRINLKSGLGFKKEYVDEITKPLQREPDRRYKKTKVAEDQQKHYWVTPNTFGSIPASYLDEYEELQEKTKDDEFWNSVQRKN